MRLFSDRPQKCCVDTMYSYFYIYARLQNAALTDHRSGNGYPWQFSSALCQHSQWVG